MSRYGFALAGPQDDAQLRERMAADWMDGNIAVSFRREPSYFAGCALQGGAHQVIKCTELASGRIVGMGSRAKARVHVNGAPTEVGYLADLRAAPEARRGALLARGYRYLQALHEADPLPHYFTVILEGNQAALGSLVGARAGLPHYQPLGRMLTPALHLDLPKRSLRVAGVEFTRGRTEWGDAIVAFLNRTLAARQFSPVYAPADFEAGGRLAGLRFDDFFLAWRNGAIVGALAAWDQKAVRQTHIERYAPGLAALRPAYNLAARFTPLRRLPAPGARVPYLYLACIAVEKEDVGLFDGLLRFVHAHLRKGEWHYAIVGLHERDPLAAVLGDYRAIDAAGCLFSVHYPSGPQAPALDGRIPRVEMALA